MIVTWPLSEQWGRHLTHFPTSDSQKDFLLYNCSMEDRSDEKILFPWGSTHPHKLCKGCGIIKLLKEFPSKGTPCSSCETKREPEITVARLHEKVRPRIVDGKIEGLQKYHRHPNGIFEDLPLEIGQKAHQWLDHFCRRWEGNLPRWKFAILVGQARRLAWTTREERSAWGRRMLAKRGGYAVQRRYFLEGRTGRRHPAHRAAWIHSLNAKARREMAQNAR